MSNAYDAVNYPSWPITRTHPAALGALAALFGRPIQPFESSRVLEIGCGEGVNLMSMAVGAPSADFVGVDLAEAPIAAGQALARTAGLDNVRLEVGNIEIIREEYGLFDTIIAHGVYSWIPGRVRTALMKLAGALLRPDGLAYISYDALPGCRARQILRDIMLHAARDCDEPGARLKLARDALERQAQSWSAGDALQNALIEEARTMLERPPEVLFHDELAALYEPQQFSAVVAAARDAGLEYLCDAAPFLSAPAFFPPSGDASTGSPADWREREQISDFSSLRRFRRSVFCRGGAIDASPDARKLRGLWVFGELQSVPADAGAPDDFKYRNSNGVTVTARDPRLARFLADVGAAWPQALPLDGLAEEADLGQQIIRLFLNKVVTLATRPFPLAAKSGERPRASPLARAQAARGDHFLATLQHGSIEIADATTREFVALLDGSRALGAIARAVSVRQGLDEGAAAQLVGRTLHDLARLALMAG